MFVSKAGAYPNEAPTRSVNNTQHNAIQRNDTQHIEKNHDTKHKKHSAL
jgi:hypothetical protein